MNALRGNSLPVIKTNNMNSSLNHNKIGNVCKINNFITKRLI